MPMDHSLGFAVGLSGFSAAQEQNFAKFCQSLGLLKEGYHIYRPGQNMDTHKICPYCSSFQGQASDSVTCLLEDPSQSSC